MLGSLIWLAFTASMLFVASQAHCVLREKWDHKTTTLWFNTNTTTANNAVALDDVTNDRQDDLEKQPKREGQSNDFIAIIPSVPVHRRTSLHGRGSATTSTKGKGSSDCEEEEEEQECVPLFPPSDSPSSQPSSLSSSSKSMMMMSSVSSKLASSSSKGMMRGCVGSKGMKRGPPASRRVRAILPSKSKMSSSKSKGSSSSSSQVPVSMRASECSPWQ